MKYIRKNKRKERLKKQWLYEELWIIKETELKNQKTKKD